MRQSLWSATVSEHHSAFSAAHLGLSVQYASVDMRRDINMLGGHEENLHFGSQHTALMAGKFWMEMCFVLYELKFTNKNTVAWSGALIFHSKFLSAVIIMSFWPSSVYLSYQDPPGFPVFAWPQSTSSPSQTVTPVRPTTAPKNP